MKFDKTRVYTAVNADELKLGSKVIVANYLESLKSQVEANSYPYYIVELSRIMGTSSTNRFGVGNKTFNLAYLISEPEEKKLKWTDLKLGDVIKQKDSTISYLITGVDSDGGCHSHIMAGKVWIDDDCLCNWEKVEK